MAKYLIIQSESGLPCAVVFSEALSHKDVAGNMKVISAGFCDVKEKRHFGYSESLNLESQKDDWQYIELALNH